jgi:hypothetical protein
MQPPALVLPARVRKIVQPLSLIILFRISAAAAVSRDVNDISRMASIMGTVLIFLMSTCLTGLFKSFFLFIKIAFILSIQNAKRVIFCKNKKTPQILMRIASSIWASGQLAPASYILRSLTSDLYPLY